VKDVLFIDCCIRRELSRTLKLAEAFVFSLKQSGAYTIETLTLMDEPLSFLSEGFFDQRERLIAQGSLDHPRFRYAHRFQKADKIVIAAPFWDLSFPALLKIYIENVCVDGITFHCDQNGCVGTCCADRLLFLTTRGGNYEKSPLENATKYLSALCEFWGIPQFDCIAADGLDLGLESPEAILAIAIREAKILADAF